MRYRDFGLYVYDERRATKGVTLFSPLNANATYLIGMRGDVIHSWHHPLKTGTYGYLLENGNLLWSGMLPDRITIFKHPILRVVNNDTELFEQIKRTLWHEIAHYYGLDHDRINELQARSQFGTN